MDLIKGDITTLDLDCIVNAANENLVEEVGSANIFSLKGNILKTPRLAGSILPGVTRDAVLNLAEKNFGLKVEETDLHLDEMLEADEVFCTGTAVVVTPIGRITTDKCDYSIGDGKMGKVTLQLRKKILEIQTEKCIDDFGWISHIDD